MTMMIPIEELLPFIGLSSIDHDFQDFLDKYYVFNFPEKIYDEDGDFDFDQTRSSMSYLSERNSVVFEYAEACEYKLLHNIKIPIAGDFVFQELFIFPKSHGFIGYKGNLPFGLNFKMKSHDIRTKLGECIFIRNLSNNIVLETFYIANFIVNISYENSNISTVGIRRPDFYDLQFLKRPLINFPPVNDSSRFDATQWLPFLGDHFFTPELDAALPPYTLEEDVELDDCLFCILVDLIQEYGVTLYYNNSHKYQDQMGIKDQGIIFSGFRLSRRGEKYSKGFQGKMAFNLNFSMPLEEIIDCIGSSPDKTGAAGAYRFYTWYLSDHILYINYDLIKNRVVSFSFYGLFMKQHLA